LFFGVLVEVLLDDIRRDEGLLSSEVLFLPGLVFSGIWVFLVDFGAFWGDILLVDEFCFSGELGSLLSGEVRSRGEVLDLLWGEVLFGEVFFVGVLLLFCGEAYDSSTSGLFFFFGFLCS